MVDFNGARLGALTLAASLVGISGFAAPAALAQDAGQQQAAGEDEPQVDLGWLAGVWAVRGEDGTVAEERYWISGEEILGYYIEPSAKAGERFDSLIKLGVEDGYVVLRTILVREDLTALPPATYLLRSMDANSWEFHNPQSDETMTYNRLGEDAMQIEFVTPSLIEGLEDEISTSTYRRIAP